MTQKFRKIANLSLVVTFLAITLITGVFVPMHASAEDTPPASSGSLISNEVEGFVKRKNYYMFLRACFDGIDIDEVTQTEVNNWDYFEGAAHNKYRIGGNYFGPGKDATWSCESESVIGDAFTSLGMTDSRRVFCELAGSQIVREDTVNDNEYDDNEDCYSRSFPGHDVHWDNNASNSTRRESFENLVKSKNDKVEGSGKYGPGSADGDVTGGLPAYAEYLRTYVSFMKQCGVDSGSVTITADPYVAGSENGSDAKYKLAIVNADTIKDPSKPVKYVLATGQSTSGSQVAIEATNSGTEYKDGDGENDGVANNDTWPRGIVKSCREAAADISSKARAYADYLMTHPSALEGSTDIPGGGTADGEAADPCGGIDSSFLRWITCPLIEISIKATEGINALIRQFMFTPTDEIFGQDFQNAQATFRNLGLGLIVIAALVMVISQAMGSQLVDAYTIKKVFPRILVAAIGIALSWPIMEFVITLFNDLGLWGHDLIIGAFPNTSASGGTSVLSGILTSVIGVGAGLALGVMGLLSLLWTAVLAMLVGLVVLSIRQMVIIVCVIMAPFAIACYVLPGTQKIWEFWKNAFMTSLFMFPIITMFLASGQGLSGVLNTSQSQILHIMSLVVYIAPYFLLPFAFKLAGGLMATVFSIANDKGRGAFDRAKNFRGQKLSKNMADIKSGNRFSERNRLTRGFNRTTAGLTQAGRAGIQTGFGTTRRGRQQVREGVAQGRMSGAMNDVMKNPAWATIQEDDDALKAATYGSAREAQAALTKKWGGDAVAASRAQRAAAAAQQSIGYGRSQQIAAAQQLATTGTGYADLEEQAETIARASGGNASTSAAISGYNNFISKQKGRYDLVPGAGELNNLATGKSTDFDRARVTGARSADPVTILRGKKNQTQGLTQSLGKHLEKQTSIMMDSNQSSSAREAAAMEVKQTIGQINQLDASKAYASQENQMVVNELVAGSQDTIARATAHLGAQGNGAEHLDDIRRFSATPQRGGPNDANMQPPGA